ncbi:MarR family winged helix-turn-helix transcriptional regulator [Streptomyces sp. NPDC060194]|uniref:MarR family winged helix-turn-helix transcriptional regulator n=1 Tax=Streptomyces sp. NPDC060194 TaxID=3347069 RepID=UPI003656FD31
MARQPHELLHLLTRAERLAARRVQAVLDAFDCSVDAWRVLDLLSADEGRNMTSLADDAALPAPTLTKLMDQLVDQNWVFRRVDPADRRRVLVQLTPRGLARRRQLSRAVKAEGVPGLDGGEETQLVSLLGRLSEALADDRAEVTPGAAARGVGRPR